MISRGLLLASFAIVVTVVLTGCSTTKTQQVPLVIEPPQTLVLCPQMETWPNPDTLTNQEIADTLVQLVQNNATCFANMEAIRDYITRAKNAVNVR